MSVATASILHPQLDIEERLEPAHEQIVRETLPLVGEHIEEIAPVFYGRMFAAHPELLRDTFNRGDFGLETQFNLVHGSDSEESAAREIALWFPNL